MKKIIIDAQQAVGTSQSNYRGINHFSKQIIDCLLTRKKYNYDLLFFDYHRGALNYFQAKKLFEKYNVPFHECNDLDYRVIKNADSDYGFCKDLNADLFYFPHYNPLPATFNKKIVVTVHDMSSVIYSKIAVDNWAPSDLRALDLGIEKLNRLQPVIMTDSVSAKNEILQCTKVPEKNIHVVYLSCNEAKLYPEKNTEILSSLGINGDYILFLAAIEPKKNVERIIKAFNHIAGKNKSLQLVLAGNNTNITGSIKNAIAECVYKDRIILTGYVSEDEKRVLYSSALFLAFPSLCEGFGLPVLEAMRCGCPVITSSTTSLPEVAGDAGILVDPLDIDQITDAFERTLLSNELREQMRIKGLKQSEKFSWNETAGTVEKVFESAINC